MGKFVAHWSFAQQNQWDLSNYDSFDMKALGEDSYRDLSGIGIPTAKMQSAGSRFTQPARLREVTFPTPLVDPLTASRWCCVAPICRM